MALWRQLSRGVRVLVRRRDADLDVSDEVRHYLDEATAAHQARGLGAREARRAARLELGGESSVHTQVRAYGWENLVSTTLSDLRYAGRRLRRDPVFTLLAAATLALGIGAVTAIFSAAHPILFEPLPYPHGERIATIWETQLDGSRIETTFAAQRAVMERTRAFESLALMRSWQPTLLRGAANETEPERLDGQRVSAEFFRVLGVPPALGRDFAAAEDRPGAPRVAILSDALWRRRLGGDPSILGRGVELDGDSYTVIGVMPPAFENVLAPTAALWTALRYDPTLPQASGHHLRAVARLRPGVGLAAAARELAALAPTLRRELPEAHVGSGFLVTSLQQDVTRDVAPALLAVIGAALLLLLLACVNVANLVLVRGARRRGEVAVRAALGAGGARLVRQLLAESLLLAALGGALGALLAAAGVRLLVALSPLGLPRAHAIEIDGTVLAFGTLLTAVVGVAFGLVPALRAARSDPHDALVHAAGRAGASHRRAAGGLLVVAEVALALALLVGCGLLLRSLQHLLAVPTGLSPERVLVMQVQTAGRRFDDAARTRRFFADALAAVREVPGVAAAGLTSQLPLSGDDETYGVAFESSPDELEADGHSVHRYAVSPGAFETLGIPVRDGRRLDDRDGAAAPFAAVLSESLARRVFPDASPLGHRLKIGPRDGPWYTIVGVVGDVAQGSLAAGATDGVYVTTDQWWFADNALWLVVRAHGDAAALAPAVRRAVWSVDRDQPVVRTTTMDALVAASAARQRFAAVIFELFALVALALAAAGIYGVLSGSVAQRKRELGVRAALGATKGEILGGVLRQGLRLSALGAAIGLVAALLASRAIGALLYGVTRFDPLTYGSVLVLLMLVATMASCAPAWRAARLDPAVTLRED